MFRLPSTTHLGSAVRLLNKNFLHALGAQSRNFSSHHDKRGARPRFFDVAKPDPVLIASRGVYAQRAIKTLNMFGIPAYSLAIKGDTEVLRGSVNMVDVQGTGTSALLDYHQHAKLAEQLGVSAVLVGWGGYSENPDAHDAFHSRGIWTVAPESRVIRTMGDKVQAKEMAEKAGFDVTKNSMPSYNSMDILRWMSEENIDFPIIVKAQEGGGGKGIRVVFSKDEFEEKFHSAQSEAINSFNNNRMFAEEYLDQSQHRHLELQVMGDVYGKACVLGVRDCTLQLNGQKWLEETGATCLFDDEGRALTELIGYSNAGTLEFLYNPDSGRLVFMEMNTRLQVEHCVTQAQHGLDFIEWQLRLLEGAHISDLESKLVPFSQRPYVIEARLNAQVFSEETESIVPKSGSLGFFQKFPDPSTYMGAKFLGTASSHVSDAFDSNFGLLLAQGIDRDQALVELKRQLLQTHLPASNRDLLLASLDSPDFQNNEHTIATLSNLITNTKFQESIKSFSQNNKFSSAEFVLGDLTTLIHEGGYRFGEGVDFERYPTTKNITDFIEAKKQLDLLPYPQATPYSQFLKSGNYLEYIHDLKSRIQGFGGGMVTVDSRDVQQAAYDSQSPGLISFVRDNAIKLGFSFGIVGFEQGGAQYQKAAVDGFDPFVVLERSINSYLPAFSLQRSQWANGLDEKSDDILNIYYDHVNQVVSNSLDVSYDIPAWHPYNFHFGNHPKADESTAILLKKNHIPIPTWVFSDRFTIEQLEQWVCRQLKVFDDHATPLLQIRIKNPSQGRSWNTDAVKNHIGAIRDVFKIKGKHLPIFYIHSHEFNGQAAHVARDVLRWGQDEKLHIVVDTAADLTHPNNEVVADVLYLTTDEMESLAKFNSNTKIANKLLSRFDSREITPRSFSFWPGGTGASDEKTRQDLAASGINVTSFELKCWQERAADLIGISALVTPSSEYVFRVAIALLCDDKTKNLNDDEIKGYVANGGKIALPDDVLIGLFKWETNVPQSQFVQDLLLSMDTELSMALTKQVDIPDLTCYKTDRDKSIVAGFGKIGLDFLEKKQLTPLLDAPHILHANPADIQGLPFQIGQINFMLNARFTDDKSTIYQWMVDGVSYETLRTNQIVGTVNDNDYLRADKRNDNHFSPSFPGEVLDIFIQSGDVIKEGMPLLKTHAMKMENTTVSDVSNVGKKVKTVYVKPGDKIEQGQLVIEFEDL